MTHYRVYFKETIIKYVDVEANSRIEATSKTMGNPNFDFSQSTPIGKKTSKEFLSVEETDA